MFSNTLKNVIIDRNKYNDVNMGTITTTDNVNTNRKINGTKVGYLRFARSQYPKNSKTLVLFRPFSL